MPRTMGGKIGFMRSGTITPIVIDERVRRPRAMAFGI